MKDLVTVFTPVYNRKNLIGNLYQSLLSQTYKNFEWIIVDDGSTDDIDEIIKSYQNEDRILIRFIKQENGGNIEQSTMAYYMQKENYFIL